MDKGWATIRLTAGRLPQTADVANPNMRDTLVEVLRLPPKYWLMIWIGLSAGGAISTFFTLRLTWREYCDAFPAKVTALSGPLRRRAVRSGRLLAFAAAVPALTAFQLLLLVACGLVLLVVRLEG